MNVGRLIEKKNLLLKDAPVAKVESDAGRLVYTLLDLKPIAGLLCNVELLILLTRHLVCVSLKFYRPLPARSMILTICNLQYIGAKYVLLES